MAETLKGKIEYYTYVWHSGGGCDACNSLDGEEFESAEDIPNAPHPNCQCYVELKESEDKEALYKKEEKKKEQEEEKKEENYDELELLRGDSLSLIDEIRASINLFQKDYINLNGDNKANLIVDYLQDLYSLERKVNPFPDSLSNGYYLEGKELKSFIQEKRAELDSYETHYQKILNYLDTELIRYEKNIQKENSFKDDTEKHEELLDLVRHSQNLGGDELLHDYEEVQRIHDEDTKMDAAVYKNNKEVVVLYPGSQQLDDYLKTDKELVTKKENDQYEKAKEVFERVKNNPEFENHKIIVVGYSLGGNTGTVIGAENNVDTVIFAPFASEKDVVQKLADETGRTIEIHPEKIIVYQQEGDQVTRWESENGHIGNIYQIPVDVGPVESHFLENMGDLNSRTDLDYPNPRTIYYPKNENMTPVNIRAKDEIIKYK